MSCARHSGVVISLQESMIPEIDGREETSILSVCVALNYTMFPVVLVFQQKKILPASEILNRKLLLARTFFNVIIMENNKPHFKFSVGRDGTI